LQVLKDKNNTVEKYIKNTALSNQNTAYEYRKRLDSFGLFAQHDYSLSLDELITTLTAPSHGPKLDVYDLLSSYISYLHNSGNVSPITIKQRVSTARSYLETFDVDISPRKFKVKVKMPRVIQTTKEALEKQDIINILNACSSIKLKTYVLFLAATGCRATEAVSTRMCDFNFEVSPARVFLRGEFTKTKTDRYVFLTNELVQQLKLWFDFKYRTRNIGYYDRVTRTSTNDKRTPTINNELFLFSTIHSRNLL
jgi:integrase